MGTSLEIDVAVSDGLAQGSFSSANERLWRLTCKGFLSEVCLWEVKKIISESLNCYDNSEDAFFSFGYPVSITIL